MDIYCVLRQRRIMMLAKFEKRAYAGSEKLWVGKYRNLHNISHWHMEHELIACKSGHAHVMLDDEMLVIVEGECVFCQSGSVHYIDSEEDCTLFVCIFNEKMNADITSRYRLTSPVFQDRYSILPKLVDIRRELKQKPVFFEKKTENMISEILVDIFRGEELEPAMEQPSAVINKYKQLLSHIDREFEYITFSEAAEFMNLSEAYFSRYFKKQAGMTFSQYLNIVKIEKAVAMLAAEPGAKATEVMLRCGFSTIRSFNRTFKDVTGYTPKNVPAGYVLNARSVPAVQDTFDPTLASAVLLTE